MEVINPMMTGIGNKKWKCDVVTESKTLTFPEEALVFYMVFGAGGNPGSAATGGAGSGHLNAGWIYVKEGYQAIATLGAETTTLGAGGQASSVKFNDENGNLVTSVSASGGSSPTSEDGAIGGSAGGGSAFPQQNSGVGGTASYGGGGAGGASIYQASPAYQSGARQGGAGGVWGGGGGAGGASFGASGTMSGGNNSISNRGQTTANSPSSSILYMANVGSVHEMTTPGAGSGKSSEGPISYYISDYKLLVNMFSPVLKHFGKSNFLDPNVGKSFLNSQGAPSGGGGGRGMFSIGGSSQAPDGSSKPNVGTGGGGGGGFLNCGTSPVPVAAPGGGGGGGFLSNPSASANGYGGRGTGVNDTGSASTILNAAKASGGCRVNSTKYLYGKGGIAIFIY